MIWRYIKIAFYFFQTTLQSKLQYRFNFFLQMLYGPAYVLVLFCIVQLAFNHTETLIGWTKQEVLLAFGIFQALYAMAALSFLSGIRRMLWYDYRQGKLDLVLTKPINSQFLAYFSVPSVEQLPLLFGALMLIILQLKQIDYVFSWQTVLFFLLTIVAAYLIYYFSAATYASSIFFVSKAAQVIEVFDKATDIAHYPMPLFPQSIQVFAFTILPVAFLSYVPTLVLLGRANMRILISIPVILLFFILTNTIAWRRGVRRYSSASS